MSGEKTEQPTDKKLKESAEKGQSYKSKDIVAACIIAAGVLGLSVISLGEVADLYKDVVERGLNLSPDYVVDRAFRLFLQLIIPFIGICIVATIIPSFAQSKFVLAFDAIKLNFDALNPVNGFKKIFNLKTVKEFVKALIYLTTFIAVTYSFFKFYEHVLIELIYVPTAAVAKIWMKVGTTIVLLCLLAFILIIIFDGLADYFLYIKDQKMDKHEVKEEYKEQEGNHEMKSRRKEMHHEILSAQDQMNIEQSNFVLANPTHIAIGIYVNEQNPLPFVSLHAQGEKARAIIAYAERHGTPVVRDILVARRLFKMAQVYTYIPMEMVDPIYRILLWLAEVKLAHLREQNPELVAKLESEALAEPSLLQ